MTYAAAITHVLPLTTIRRERLLSRPGQVLVSASDRVEASTVVAQAEAVGRHYIFDLAQRLGLSAAELDREENLAKYIKVESRTPVDKGALLAARSTLLGLRQLLVRAPSKGQLLAVGGGKMLFAAQGAAIELKAGFSGVISKVNPEYGVEIETVGALVQGWWGSGKQSYGVLRAIVPERDQQLTVAALDENAKGTILVAGTADQQALRAADTMKVRGLILGSLPASLVPVARALSYPILITETFGQKAMSEPAWRLLTVHEGREATVDARFADRWSRRRPEVIIPLPAAGTPPPVPNDGAPLAVGKRVRLLRPPFAGLVGVIKSLPDRRQSLPSGIHMLAAQVEVEGQGPVLAPLVNLELFE